MTEVNKLLEVCFLQFSKVGKNKPNLSKISVKRFNDEVINFNRLLTRYPLPALESLELDQDRIEFLNLTNFGSLKRKVILLHIEFILLKLNFIYFDHF